VQRIAPLAGLEEAGLHELRYDPQNVAWDQRDRFLLSIGHYAIALYGGLILAPPDYQQKDAFRIVYVHAPSAIMSLQVYVVMAAAAAQAPPGVTDWAVVGLASGYHGYFTTPEEYARS
jgi:hypothetical protein